MGSSWLTLSAKRSPVNQHRTAARMKHGWKTSKLEVGIVAKEAKSAEPKMQHYVPQFYLRGFVGTKDQLIVVDRRNKKVFRTGPGNVAGETHFNRIEAKAMVPSAVERCRRNLKAS